MKLFLTFIFHPGFSKSPKWFSKFTYIKVYSLCCKVLCVLTNAQGHAPTILISYRIISLPWTSHMLHWVNPPPLFPNPSNHRPLYPHSRFPFSTTKCSLFRISFFEQEAFKIYPCFLVVWELISFYHWVILHCINVPWIIFSFIYWKITWLIPVFEDYDKAAINIHMQGFVCF